MAIGTAVLFSWDNFRKLVSDWITLPAYSHGILIPLVFILLVYLDRKSLPVSEDIPSHWGLVLTAIGVLCLVSGRLSGLFFIELAKFGANSGQWRATKTEIDTILKIEPNNAYGWTFSGQWAYATGHPEEAQKDYDHALSLQSELVQALVAYGDLKRHKNDPKHAKEFYQKALSKDSNNSHAWTGLGMIAYSEGRKDEAMTDFRKAVAVDPSNVRSQIVLGNFLAQTGRIQEAISLLKAVPAKTADIRVPIKIAEYEVVIGKNAKAIQLLRPMAQQKIQISDIYYVLAKAYQNSGKQQDSLEMIDLLLAIKGTPAFMMLEAAKIALNESRPDVAEKILSSLENTPDLPASYWITKSQIEARKNHPGQAIRIIEEGLRNYPNDSSLLLDFVDAQIQGKNYKIALSNLKALIKKDPKNPVFISRMGILLGHMQDFKSEIAYYQKSSRTYPDLPAIEVLYLLALVSNKKISSAILEAKNYIKTHPNAEIVQVLLSDFYLQTDQIKLASENYKSILKRNPKNLQALVGLAGLEFFGKHLVEAESLYRRALIVAPNNPNIQVGLGETLLSENQREEALKIFEQALSENPNQPIALFEVAKNDLVVGDSHDAMTHLAPLIKLPFTSKRKAEVELLLGLAYQNNGDLKNALDAFKKAIRLDPNNANYHESLGTLYADIFQFDKALPEYEMSLKIQPRNPSLKIKSDWARVNLSKGKPDLPLVQKVVEASQAFRKSNPGDVSISLIEANGDLLLKKTDNAMEVFTYILANHPENRQALFGKANILLFQKHIHQAQKIVEQILTNNPNDIKGNLVMAEIDRNANNIYGEIDHLEKVHLALPNQVGPALELASADLSLKRYEEAKSAILALHESYRKLLPVLYILATAEMGLKEYDSALKDLKALASMDQNPGPIYNMASFAAMRMGNQDMARKYLDLAIKHSPNDPLILNNMAFYLADHSQNLPKALDIANKALKLAPQPYIQDTVGFVLFKMGEYEKAESHFSSAFNAHFRDSEFLYHMGMNEWKLGKNGQAANHLKEAVNSGKLTREEKDKAEETLQALSRA